LHAWLRQSLRETATGGQVQKANGAPADIIKGFACEVAETAVPNIQALSTQYPPLVEGDGIVTTQGEKGKDGVHF
jgi:hypothetical protein